MKFIQFNLKLNVWTSEKILDERIIAVALSIVADKILFLINDGHPK